MDKNLQFLELKRMDPDVISPAKRKKNYKEIYGGSKLTLRLPNHWKFCDASKPPIIPKYNQLTSVYDITLRPNP